MTPIINVCLLKKKLFLTSGRINNKTLNWAVIQSHTKTRVILVFYHFNIGLHHRQQRTCLHVKKKQKPSLIVSHSYVFPV